MCQDCPDLVTNTGLVNYSGPTLELCNGVSIVNGEELTSVISKFDNCIGALQNQLDITGLVIDSPCVSLVQTSLKTVLQSILNSQASFCTQLETLTTKVNNLQSIINNTSTSKVVSVTACDTSRVSVSQSTTTTTFKINGLIPPKTILPYFGAITDFSPTGLGLSNTPMAGWAIANGQNGTINAIGNFIKYGSTVKVTPSGSNSVTLQAPNIPQVPFKVNANFDLDFEGETESDGEHTHKLRTDRDAADNCNPDIPNSCGDTHPPCRDSVDTSGSDTQVDTSVYMGSSGCHTHKFHIDATATGSFNATVGNEEPSAISIIPQHLQAIPIMWVGCI